MTSLRVWFLDRGILNLAIRFTNAKAGLALIAIFITCSIHAAQPPLPLWVPLTKDKPAPASIARKTVTDTSLNVIFSIPGLEASEVSSSNGIHGRLTVPDSGTTSEIGKPELPVIRRLIVVPDGVTLNLRWKATPLNRPLSAFGFRGPLRPVQRPIPKIPGAREKAIFEKDASTYATDAWLPAEPVTLQEAGTLSGRRLVMIEVSPVAYNPAKGETRLYSQIEVAITFAGPKSTTAPSPLLPSEVTTLQSLTLNSDNLSATDSQPGRLLIISPGNFTNTLAPFVTHKQNMGWTVDVFSTNATGSTTTKIRSFITNRYWNVNTRPTALLLVGDTGQIPCFTGTQTDNPDTDLYYTCMDNSTDWIPEFPVGRFSAINTTQLGDIIKKSIATETNAPAAWNKQAAFIAGYDATYYAVPEDTHNTVIANHLAPLGYISDKLYRYSYSANKAQFSAAFNAGRIVGVYSGHGDDDGWYYENDSSPVNFGQAEVNSLTNAGRYPLIASFACLTGKFSQPECFAETWLRAADKGASAVLASSVNSSWDQDDILEKKLFDAIFGQSKPSTGTSIITSKELFRQHYGSISTTQLYFEMYNLMGDPTLLILPRPFGFTPWTAPTAYTNKPYSLQFCADAAQAPFKWSIASGVLPPGFNLNTNSGLISGTSSSTGTYTFSIQLTDASLSSTSRLYQLPVIEHLRPPLNTTMPVAVSNRPYQATLSSRGGLPQVSWEWQTIYTASNTTSGWLQIGIAKNWQADDRSWALALPWPFPFYGQTHTSLWVCSNGFLDFENSSSNYLNTTEEFIERRMIAPLWDDLDTLNRNINVSTNENYVSIRWLAQNYSDGSTINVQALLFRTGLIQFNYGSPALTNLTPTIGISAGNGSDYYLSSRNGTNAIPANVSESFTPNTPAGLVCTPTGTVTGRPSQTGTFIIPCRITDSASPHETTNFNLSLTIRDRLTFSVTSPYGTPSPSTNVMDLDMETNLPCSIANSPFTSGTTQYVCSGWTGTGSATNGTATNTTLLVTTNTTLCWLWKTNYLLTITTSGSGTVSGTTGWIPSTTNVTLGATPASWHHFDGWHGNVTPAETNLSSISLAMTQPRSVLALFNPDLTTQGTPLWWLVSHNLTNSSFDTEDTADEDKDGMNAWAEYIAGTDPTNDASALRLTSLTWTNGQPYLQWQSANGPIQPPPPYIIWASTNLMTTNWLSITNIPTRTPPTNATAVIAPFPAVPTFYRITISN